MRKIFSIATLGKFYADGNWKITSQDLPGLILAGKDLPALLRDIPKAVKILLEKNYGMTEVKVDRAVSPVFFQKESYQPIAPKVQWTASGELSKA